MFNALKAGFLYFLLVFAAGFIAGTLRALFLAPRTGYLLAVGVEVPIMFAVSWLACRWLLARIAVADAAFDRALMGAIAFVLLMIGEALLSLLLSGRDHAAHFALYRTPPVQLGLIAQIAFALFPLAQANRRRF